MSVWALLLQLAEGQDYATGFAAITSGRCGDTALCENIVDLDLCIRVLEEIGFEQEFDSNLASPMTFPDNKVDEGWSGNSGLPYGCHVDSSFVEFGGDLGAWWNSRGDVEFLPKQYYPLLCDCSSTRLPTPRPTPNPTIIPTPEPTPVPTTATPTVGPTLHPTTRPSASPSRSPTPRPTARPTPLPTPHPTANPSHTPTANPTMGPTSDPTPSPTSKPTSNPTPRPTALPTGQPTSSPTELPTPTPTTTPTTNPTSQPTLQPTEPDLEVCSGLSLNLSDIEENGSSTMPLNHVFSGNYGRLGEMVSGKSVWSMYGKAYIQWTGVKWMVLQGDFHAAPIDPPPCSECTVPPVATRWVVKEGTREVGTAFFDMECTATPAPTQADTSPPEFQGCLSVGSTVSAYSKNHEINWETIRTDLQAFDVDDQNLVVFHHCQRNDLQVACDDRALGKTSVEWIVRDWAQKEDTCTHAILRTGNEDNIFQTIGCPGNAPHVDVFITEDFILADAVCSRTGDGSLPSCSDLVVSDDFYASDGTDANTDCLYHVFQIVTPEPAKDTSGIDDIWIYAMIGGGGLIFCLLFMIAICCWKNRKYKRTDLKKFTKKQDLRRMTEVAQARVNSGCGAERIRGAVTNFVQSDLKIMTMINARMDQEEYDHYRSHRLESGWHEPRSGRSFGGRRSQNPMSGSASPNMADVIEIPLPPIGEEGQSPTRDQRRGQAARPVARGRSLESEGDVLDHFHQGEPPAPHYHESIASKHPRARQPPARMILSNNSSGPDRQSREMKSSVKSSKIKVTPMGDPNATPDGGVDEVLVIQQTDSDNDEYEEKDFPKDFQQHIFDERSREPNQLPPGWVFDKTGRCWVNKILNQRSDVSPIWFTKGDEVLLHDPETKARVTGSVIRIGSDKHPGDVQFRFTNGGTSWFTASQRSALLQLAWPKYQPGDVATANYKGNWQWVKILDSAGSAGNCPSYKVYWLTEKKVTSVWPASLLRPVFEKWARDHVWEWLTKIGVSIEVAARVFDAGVTGSQLAKAGPNVLQFFDKKGAQNLQKEIKHELKMQPRRLATMDISDVLAWLHSIGQEKYKDVFLVNTVDGQILRELTEESLETTYRTSPQDARKIVQQIKKLARPS